MSAERSARLTARNELACAWVTAISLLFSILGFVVLAGYVPPPHADDSAAEIARFYSEDSTRIRSGPGRPVHVLDGMGGIWSPHWPPR